LTSEKDFDKLLFVCFSIGENRATNRVDKKPERKFKTDLQATIEMWYIIFRPPKTVLKRRRNDGEKNRKKSLQKDGAMWYIVMVASREAAEMFLEN
jgi:hypothetical protein